MPDARFKPVTLATGAPMPDAEVRLCEHFFCQLDSTRLFEVLRETVSWRHEQIKIFGRSVDVPRLVAWHGDPGASYTYSGIRHEPAAWTSELLEINARVQLEAGCRFNSVLLNYYRGGADSMGWHSDAEPELGQSPVIASVSFGTPRRFLLRRIDNHAAKAETVLTDGSLLIMAGPTQHFWQHAIPKATRNTGPRINLTYRAIFR